MTCPVPGCQSLPDCHPHDCARCQSEDAGERAAIQVEGQSVNAWQAARTAILRERVPGQKRLAVA
jgi:hypothetical protein